ncbi:hypothetical protein Tco_0920464 [Tanacetum coccineum]
MEEESLSKQLEEVNIEAEASRNLAFQELLKQKRLEALAIEANTETSSCSRSRRKAAEDTLNTAIVEHKQLM